MVIIALLYLFLVWLVFAKLRWLSWGWGAGTATVLVGLFIAALFAGALNYLAPTGRVVVISRVVEVTPNVSGQINEISVKANAPVKAGTVLFTIDPAPYDAQVRIIEAQLGFQELRLSQMKELQASSSGRAFDVQERQSEVDQLKARRALALYL
ncbi:MULTISPECIES: biotin/lipoyl-binding protein [unclassified Bradyrhizobium]|jgi:multidrug resistance efflux pump|uniref:biotin/lipoyl-binding protein n=1 Tax=unclassified Bradyrhizobium TaxID=2631580 RepID=UPI001FFB8E15|nr:MULTISPECIES: biotin/lipoyl-binding protein [unclassified Bradyrhizobium]MCK1269007.1 biotin/lipoyl-binding protein [Bradyrhizobium sp. 84]MCK1354103.1 biotin/lipoyl-binding protein [Bradyrhizobium sp. CW7]MCK1373603.1 biotin/lipoyl-binding protein [Bradyrhizobium sp. 49]MCK1419061.1 biotin/lipoyl-binding protein [Bradyrhizobium sp. CW4]MCK1432291.1 biotin/lipoyl-binding protein [Bradyrhizobium sp. 87]